MKEFSWVNKDLTHLHIELTNICNASCPLCSRNLNKSSRIRPDMKLTFITLEQFKEWFDIDFIKKLRRLVICGTHGEPTMVKQFVEIIEYVLSNNNRCETYLNTNGGARDEIFWARLGKLSKQYNTFKVTFSIDGLEDTNYLYRRNINWNRLIKNVKSYIDNGGVAIWDFLVFNHNEHQIEEAREYSKELGFSYFFVKRALGFDIYENGYSSEMGVYSKKGKLQYKIKPPKNTEYVNTKNGHIIESTVPELITFDQNSKDKPGYNHIVEQRLKKFDPNLLDEKHYNYVVDEIKCKSYTLIQTAEIYVNCHGIVFPCCYLGTRYDSSLVNDEDNQMRYELRKFGIDNFNLNKTSIQKILQNLDATIKESWYKDKLSDGKLLFCHQTCGEKNCIDKVYINRTLGI